MLKTILYNANTRIYRSIKEKISLGTFSIQLMMGDDTSLLERRKPHHERSVLS
ncbi:hypothetical protein S1OALGB6SA_1771 [Olavius algarvensis spirochete endosymbiont]|nr:MAG: hypothetical protein [Olavius algarvensis spirochete endosymbiont]VDB00687.1 hypothetical protein S1OALGB6SA_1771 [Olavius algarvensis spirochete endosymbiont]